MDDTAIKERLKKIRGEMRLTQADFADRANINRSHLGHVESGRNKPSYDMLVSIATAHNVSLDWLVFGRGNKFIMSDADPLNNLPDEVIELILLVNQFPIGIKIKLIDLFIRQVTLLCEAQESP